MSVDWLPPLMELDNYASEGEYEEALYELFCDEWIYGHPPTLNGLRVRVRNGTAIDGKDFSFWHLLTGGGNEANGPLILERCERITWIRFLLENADHPNARVWQETDRNRKNWLVAVEDFSYVVILEERKGYLLLLTAYPEYRQRRRGKREAAFLAYTNGTKN